MWRYWRRRAVPEVVVLPAVAVGLEGAAILEEAAILEVVADLEVEVRQAQVLAKKMNAETVADTGTWHWFVMEGGGNSVQCTISGQLTVAGYTILNASYSKGNTYNVTWERWECTNSAGNCCIASSQGVRVK